MSGFPWKSIKGTAGRDSLVGENGSPNEFFGYDGDDAITGGDLLSIAHGEPGNDIINFHAGLGTALGEDGNDELSSGSSDMWTAATDTLRGGTGNDTYKLQGQPYSFCDASVPTIVENSNEGVAKIMISTEYFDDIGIYTRRRHLCLLQHQSEHATA